MLYITLTACNLVTKQKCNKIKQSRQRISGHQWPTLRRPVISNCLLLWGRFGKLYPWNIANVTFIELKISKSIFIFRKLNQSTTGSIGFNKMCIPYNQHYTCRCPSDEGAGALYSSASDAFRGLIIMYCYDAGVLFISLVYSKLMLISLCSLINSGGI